MMRPPNPKYRIVNPTVKDLILKQWWTDQHASTNQSGNVAVRGFLGDYEVTASVGNRKAARKAVLSNGGMTVRIALPD